MGLWVFIRRTIFGMPYFWVCSRKKNVKTMRNNRKKNSTYTRVTSVSLQIYLVFWLKFVLAWITETHWILIFKKANKKWANIFRQKLIAQATIESNSLCSFYDCNCFMRRCDGVVIHSENCVGLPHVKCIIKTLVKAECIKLQYKYNLSMNEYNESVQWALIS